MARLARIVVPGMPHHVTQRGNRRQQTFFCDDDYRAYLSLLVEWCGRYDTRIWAYCLMPNHVHAILVPTTADGLARDEVDLVVAMRLHGSTGRPMGEEGFVKKPQRRLRRKLLPGKHGRPKKPENQHAACR